MNEHGNSVNLADINIGDYGDVYIHGVPIGCITADGSIKTHDGIIIPKKFADTLINEQNTKRNTPIGIVSTEKYYICKHCGKLITQTQINNELESGYMGLCDCDYQSYEWNKNSRIFDIIYNKIYYEYDEIPKDVYNILIDCGTYERVKMYRSYVSGGK